MRPHIITRYQPTHCVAEGIFYKLGEDVKSINFNDEVYSLSEYYVEVTEYTNRIHHRDIVAELVAKESPHTRIPIPINSCDVNLRFPFLPPPKET